MNEVLDVAQWRRDLRPVLIERRENMAQDLRGAASETIGRWVQQVFAPPPAKVAAFCWPYRNEADLRFALRRLREAGVATALPVVAGKAQPLRFRRWWPGVAMVRGALGIPYPRDTEEVRPDIAFVPLVGFDSEGYRLGYGGGYFDRTLASLPVKPISVGVGFELARQPTIHPQPHDIPMDFILTEAGICAVAAGRLELLAADAAALECRRLAQMRGLW